MGANDDIVKLASSQYRLTQCSSQRMIQHFRTV